MIKYPARRLRRLRSSQGMRRLARETAVSQGDLICPVFVEEGIESRVQVDSMPGMERLPLGEVADEVDEILELGIPAVMLFGIPAHKDDTGSSASDDTGIVQRAISEIRAVHGSNIVVMTDTCLCQYTSSGHCGLVADGQVLNDKSTAALARVAASQARAGADVVSPSAMMDGQVAAIRAALDDAGMHNVGIMSHSAKHRSSFYSPFRDAAECAPRFGDRKTYQVPYTNAREAIREVEADIDEGVDIVMIKPALSYLDLIRETRARFDVPVSAYSVSGEYAMVRAAALNGWVDEDDIIREILHSIKRAGADMIVTYFAKQAAASLRDEP